MDPVAPLAESFRADDLYGLIDEVIEEMSSVAGGAMTFSPGRVGPPIRRKPKRKKSKKKKDLPEGMVEQVLNYLLNKEALS